MKIVTAKAYIYHNDKSNYVLIINHPENKYLITSIDEIVEIFRSRRKSINVSYINLQQAEQLIDLCKRLKYTKV